MRIFVFAVVLAAMSAYITFSALRVFRLERMKKIPQWLAWLLSLFPAAAGLSLIPITGNVPACIIAMAHLTALLLFSDILFRFFKSEKFSRTGAQAVAFVLSFAICAAYIAFGTVNAFTVTPAQYSITTDKSLGGKDLRIVQISDCHLGTTFDGEGFARHLETINACEPDILVVTGDLVDSRTTREEMITACGAFAGVDAPLGVYYVTGNHEQSMGLRQAAELYTLLRNAGVTVLEDESLTVDDRFIICGRRDAYTRSRLSVGELLSPLDHTKYTVVLDHQPREYADYAEHRADLVLSGHTHAGQMFPLGWFIEFIGMGEKTYGIEQRKDTTFIVSSGLSGLVPLRTEAKSEYVIIDITSTAE